MTQNELTQQERIQEEDDYDRSFCRTPDFTQMDGEDDFHPALFGDLKRMEEENSIQCILTGQPSKPELREFRWRNPEGYEAYVHRMRQEMGGWFEDWAKECLP